MSKDIEKSSMAQLLGGLTGHTPSAVETAKEAERPHEQIEPSTPSQPRKRYEKTENSEERVSTILDSLLLEKVKTISRTEGITIRSIIEYALSQVVDTYERKYGRIKVKKAKKGNVNDIFQN